METHRLDAAFLASGLVERISERYGLVAVITGDVTQIDLPAGRPSGLKEAQHILAGIEDIRFCAFTERDVVRHRLVQDIITAYDRFETRRDSSPSPSGRGSG